MLIYRLPMYDEFSCLMDKCPLNCCRGWNVPVDAETIEKYNDTGFFERKKFICSLKEKDGVTVFKSRFFACPFWNSDKLCSIQKTKGTDFMPRVCVNFPRARYNAGFFCEETLFMSCPGVTRLFISHARKNEHFYFNSMEGTPDYELCTTNDDKDFIEYLLKTREKIVMAFDGRIRYNSLSLLRYAYDAQIACANNDELPDFDDYTDNGEDCFMLDGKGFNELLTSGFCHPRLLPRLPLLYKLCLSFKKEFYGLNRMDDDVADKKLRSLKNRLYEKVSDIDVIIMRYYEYYIQDAFLKIYEDYSFAKHILFGMVKAQMVTIFLSLLAKEKDSISDNDIADLIAAFERRSQTLDSSYFNNFLSDVLKNM